MSLTAQTCLVNIVHKEEEEESVESDWSAEGERTKDSGAYPGHSF